MANPVLHIKDSYYFEVPKALCPSNFERMEDFPDVWVSLDEDYQDWHFDQLYDLISKISDHSGFQAVNLGLGLNGREGVRQKWKEWQHESHENFGKPFDEFLEEVRRQHVDEAEKFKAQVVADFTKHRAEVEKSGQPYKDKNLFQQAQEMYLDHYLHYYQPDFWQFSQWRDVERNAAAWQAIRRQANDVKKFKELVEKGEVKVHWDQKKVDAYNYHLSGKILIPQPFGAKLRNLYEAHPANHWYELAFSKFMVIELAVALIIAFAFIWLGRKVRHGAAPKGKIWNLLETFVVFIRDEVAEPAIGHHDAHSYVPFLWTIFFFVLGCNLMGMVPWAGSPTGTFGVTLAMALLTFFFGMVGSMGRFGFFGYFKNLVPHMDLPLVMAIIIKPGLFVIELAGLLIKHGVLGVRLLANIMAGHLVLLAIMGIAFSVEGATNMANWQWFIAAPVAILGSATLSLLELFVAFLQAYIFTFLSALFIGAALHEH